MRAASAVLVVVLAESVAGSGRWADLGTRSVSALVLAPLAVGAMWEGGWLFTLLVAMVAAILGWEWVGLCRLLSTRHSPPPLPQGKGELSYRSSTLSSRGVGGGMLLPIGLAWIALWALCLVWLRADPVVGRVDVIGLALIVWGCDIGAYAAGRLIGGPRLAPRISPGKTWSGAAGGAIAAALIATGLAAAQPHRLGLLVAAGLGFGFSVLGQLGDLAESAFKRRCGVKDSGRLIPGHGGLLDRLDATLAVVPAATLLCFLFGRGVVLWQ